MNNEFEIKTLEKEIEKIKNSFNYTEEEKKYKIMRLEYKIISLKTE